MNDNRIPIPHNDEPGCPNCQEDASRLLSSAAQHSETYVVTDEIINSNREGVITHMDKTGVGQSDFTSFAPSAMMESESAS